MSEKNLFNARDESGIRNARFVAVAIPEILCQ
jgi:hypothetical protein